MFGNQQQSLNGRGGSGRDISFLLMKSEGACT
jgi:hypothetical protein